MWGHECHWKVFMLNKMGSHYRILEREWTAWTYSLIASLWLLCWEHTVWGQGLEQGGQLGSHYNNPGEIDADLELVRRGQILDTVWAGRQKGCSGTECEISRMCLEHSRMAPRLFPEQLEGYSWWKDQVLSFGHINLRCLLDILASTSSRRWLSEPEVLGRGLCWPIWGFWAYQKVFKTIQLTHIESEWAHSPKPLDADIKKLGTRSDPVLYPEIEQPVTSREEENKRV